MKKKNKKPKKEGKRCPVCGKKKKLTRHHILPIRFFDSQPYFYYLCRKCHDELEELWIPTCSALEPSMYWDILEQFLIAHDVKKIPERPLVINTKINLKKMKERQRCLLKKTLL